MNKPTLVIMAAGLGSRFGGCKQITPVDEAGQLIIDYSIYDAARAGFGKIVCIIKPDMKDDFHEAIGRRIEKRVELVYAWQRPDMLPPGFSVPAGRSRPWGTGHAVLCAKDVIDGDFAAINADDFYGASALKSACDFLNTPGGKADHAMVGYRIENTLTEHGSVSRGICEVDDVGMLSRITERRKIEKRPGGAAFFDDDDSEVFVPAGTIVSMNLWAFRHSVLDEMEALFEQFLRTKMPLDPTKAEFYLPSVPDQLIHAGRASVQVLDTHEHWYGVTYPQDLRSVQDAMARLRAAGVYPEDLWAV